MDKFRVLEIKQNVYESNDKEAAKLRSRLRDQGLFMLNIMSSPGSGKTTTLVRTIQSLKSDYKIGVLEADIDSDVDARTVEEAGAKAIQLHTGGMCHLDADMTRQGLEGMGVQDLDLVFLENIGNLICPAEFDTGSARNAIILSVPEGTDKPLKYPLVFEVADVILVNKIDTLSLFDFDLKVFEANVRRRNPRARIIPISAKTGEGIGEWTGWLRGEISAWKAAKPNAQEDGHGRS